jgi:hypothetical protein
MKDKNSEIEYFFKNLRNIYNNDELIIKLNYDKKKNIKKHNNNYNKNAFITWLLISNHKKSEKVSKNTWNINIKSSYVPQRDGDIWIDYKFGKYNTRIFLYLKKYNKKKFKKYPNKKYMLIIRDLNENLDLLYFNSNTELLLNNNKDIIKQQKKVQYKTEPKLFREHKPLFSGVTYNKYYKLHKPTNPFINI